MDILTSDLMALLNILMIGNGVIKNNNAALYAQKKATT